MGDELVVSGISKQFSGVKAVSDVTFTVRPGEVHGLVGPNGAGKSTALGILSGFIPPDAGSITYRDRELVGAAPDSLVRAGIARTFQEPSPVPGLTVLENVLTGLHTQGHAGTLRAAVRSASRTGPARTRLTSPSASCATWRSSAAWGPAPPCCCSTSRPPAWARPRRNGSAR
jgi:branched-chain amino acid transport system ATP-binding protein